MSSTIKATRLAPSIQRLIRGRPRIAVRRTPYSPRFSSQLRKLPAAEELSSPDSSPSLLDIELAEKLERYIRAKQQRGRKASPKNTSFRTHPNSRNVSEQDGEATMTTTQKQDTSNDGKNTVSSSQVASGLTSDDQLLPSISKSASHRSLVLTPKKETNLDALKRAAILDKRKSTMIKRSHSNLTSAPRTSIDQRTPDSSETSELDGEYEYLVDRWPHGMIQEALETRDDIIQTLRQDISRASENFPRPTPTDPYATFCESLRILMEAELTATAMNSRSSKPDRKFYAMIMQRVDHALSSLNLVKNHMYATRTKILVGLSGISDIQYDNPINNHYAMKKGWTQVSKAQSPPLPTEEIEQSTGKNTTWSREIRFSSNKSSMEPKSSSEDEDKGQQHPEAGQIPSSQSLPLRDGGAPKVRGTRHIILDQTVSESEFAAMSADENPNKTEFSVELDETNKDLESSAGMDETTGELEPPFAGMHGTWLPFDVNFNEGLMGFEMKKKELHSTSSNEIDGGEVTVTGNHSDLESPVIEEKDTLEPLLDNHETSLSKGPASEDQEHDREITEDTAEQSLYKTEDEKASSKTTSESHKAA